MSMAAEHEPAKLRRYDPSMSRRTRRPVVVHNAREEDEELQEQNDGFQRMSLKELLKESNGYKIKGVPVHELMEADGGHDITKNVPGRSARAVEHERSLAVATKQAESAGMVGRCLKALGHLVKYKHSSKQRRNNPRFPLLP